jgi:polysaccharide pyruvyl transferase WcaK-like protein
MGRPLVLLPQTYGPFKGRLSRMLARYILRRSSRVFSRDEAGVDATKAIIGGNGRVIHVMPDLGFCMMPEPLDDSIKHRIVEMRSEGNVVGLNVSSLLYMGGYTGNNMFQLRESFPLLIDAVVDHLVGTLDAQILLVPHVCGGTLSQEDETRLCRRLEEKFRQKHGKRVCCLHCELNHRQMKSLIGECDLFIGARMHACIGAVSQCVPTICLAYSKKFAGVMKPLGAGARVVDLRQAAIADVIEVITKVFRERKKLRQELQPAATELLGRLNLQFASNFFLGVLTASEGTVDSCATGLENPALVRRS